MNLKSPESRRLDVPPAGLLAISPGGELAMALGCTFDPANGSCNGTLALKQMLGGAPRSIRGDVRSADWGADGKLAAIAGTFENRRVEYPLGTQLSSRVAGGHVRVSPDGRDVAWTEAADNGLDVMIRDATGVARSLGRWDSVSGLAWSPDNSAVYVSGVAETNRDDAVTRIARDGSHREVLRARTRLRILDVTPDGRLLVAQSEGSLRVFMRTIESSTSRPADLTWLGASMVDAISDDGAMVLLTVRVGAAWDWNVPLYPIFMRTTNGAMPTHLGAGYGLAVSPDRRWALSRTRPEQGQPDLAIHPLGAGESRRLERGDLDVGGGNSAAHFAGPERIVFRARRDAGPWQTYVQSIANGPPTRLQHEPGMIVSPVSPDRDQFISQRTDGSLWIATVSGRAATPLPARLESNQRIIQWSADGRELFVSTIAGTRLRVTRLEIATGRQRPVTEFEADNQAGFMAFGFGAVFITPDGKKLTYTESRTFADLFVIEGAR